MRCVWPLSLGLCLSLLLLSFPTAARAEFQTLWSLGVWDGDPLDEFGDTTWDYNAAPGSATALDNDFYFAGTYPAPIGTVAGEPPTQFEDGLDGQNPSVRLHFNLTAEQATSTARMRFTAHHVWGGVWDSSADSYAEGYGRNQLEVYWNGTLLQTVVHTHADSVIVEVNANVFHPVAGANVLEIRRAPPPASSTNGWFSFDALSLQLDPQATLDTDSDGLPRWWEEDHGLSDTDAADAAQDPDHDGRTNAQEFATQTLPHTADTDGDGLNDGAEATAGTDPHKADTDNDTLRDGEETTSNPLLADTDGDGAADAWEVRTGYLANSAASQPPPQSGVVGVKFVSELQSDNTLLPADVTGLVPQRNWNSTWPLTSWRSQTGTQGDVVSPTADTLLTSAGTASGVTLAWNFPGSAWANGQGGGSTQKLMDGYLNVNSDTPGSITFSSIPYGTYDVLVYVGSNYDGAVGATRLNDDAATDRWFITASAAPQTRFVELAKSDSVKPWRGNVVRYRGVTGSSFNLKLRRTSWYEIGLHAVQIINSTTDTDADGLPDAYEWEQHLRPDVADATLDPDGDGLNNAGEMTRKTDPHIADTDGDGLSDAVETGTGLWVSTTSTGSSPLMPDTDGDGLTDGEELAVKPVPTNPNLADTDGDGISDPDEVRGWTNPVVAESPTVRMPVVTTGSPRTFDWTVANVQVVWDHARGGVMDQEWGDHTLFSIVVRNAQSPGDDAFNVGIRVKAGRLTHYLFSGHTGGFSHPDNDDWDIWEADWQSSLTDLSPALGFSGVGRVDISDRLRFRIQGTCSTGLRTDWTFTYTLTNQDTNQVIYTRTYTQCALAQAAHDGTATWQDAYDPARVNRLQTWAHDGVQLFIQPTALEDTSAFAAAKDSDEDGMPDAWEDLHGLNKNSAADGALDGDADGLSNTREWLAGTLPTNPDTDGDHARDGLEVDWGSDPLLATSLPPFYRGLPGSVGEDLNGNGMSDAWELWVGHFGLNSQRDDDGDGMSNAAEALAGTNPLDRTSRLWSDVVRGASDITIRWPTLPLKRHQLLQSPDLVSWTTATGTPTAVAGEYRQTFALGGTRMFYSASVTDLDTDNDGVSDWAESTILGTPTSTPHSSGSSVSVDVNGDGTPEASLSGDYAALVEQLQGAVPAGGFPGAGSSSGGGAAPTAISRTQAARFLMQATFGPTLADIQQVQSLGYEGWLSAQFSQPPTLHSTYIQRIFQDMTGPRAKTDYSRGGGDADPFLFGNNMQTTFARAAIQGSDQLRQRVAFALSQILVTSRRDANLENRCLGMADYYDIFVRQAFGNYEDILMEVTLHPVMGRYLSHVGNQKADPSINRYPDENYAREVMQLFTVGLWELNPDGSRQHTPQGASIPTYSNAEITQMARVMTGFWFGRRNWGNGGWTEQDYATPMTLHADRHDFGVKTLLRGHTLPARAATPENALRDVRDAIHHLFTHPNTGVFVGKQLIQFLVTDNPSPAYVQRVGAVFADNGQGIRGDLRAVVRAILLDTEARAPVLAQTASFGRLKEPVIRTMAMARAFGMQQVPDLLWWDWSDFMNESRQAPTNSPSVFNFYRPEYRAPGLPTQNDLATPVFQITDSYSSISFPNRLWSMLENGFTLWNTYRFPLDLARECALAASPERLMDHLNLLFCAGQMKASTRSLILNALSQIPADQPVARVRVAAYLVLTSPEGAIMR